MADKDDDLFDAVSGMADRIKLKGKDRERYIHDHMTRGGYKAVPQYVPDDSGEDDDDDDDGPFFSKRRKPRGGSRRRTRDDDDDW